MYANDIWLVESISSCIGKLGQDTMRLFQTTENFSNLDHDQRNTAIAIKLDALYKLLDLSPYKNGVYHQNRHK